MFQVMKKEKRKGRVGAAVKEERRVENAGVYFPSRVDLSQKGAKAGVHFQQAARTEKAEVQLEKRRRSVVKASAEKVFKLPQKAVLHLLPSLEDNLKTKVQQVQGAPALRLTFQLATVVNLLLLLLKLDKTSKTSKTFKIRF